MEYYILLGLGALTLALIGTAGLLLLWNKPVLVIYIQILFCNVMRYLSQQFHFPDSIKYITDLLTLLLFVQIIITRKDNLSRSLKKPFWAVAFFAITALITSTANLIFAPSNIVFFFWGIRIYFRFYVFFLACVTFLSTKDIDYIFNILLALLPINTIVSCIQFFVQGYRFDNVGGLFGMIVGCNSEMNLYLLVVGSIIAARYIGGKINLLLAISGIFMIFFIAAISELKAVFIEVPVLLAIVALFSLPNRRSVILTVCGVCAILLFVPLFMYLYPSWTDFFSADSIRTYTTDANYGGNSGLNRMTAGAYILENVHLTIPSKLFGIGLGNGDWFLWFSGWFFQKYQNLLYYFFLYAFLLLEVGLLGLVAYSMFFLSVFWDSIVAALKSKPPRRFYYYVPLVMCVMSFFLMVYNPSMRSETAYLLYFSLAVPYIARNEIVEYDLPCKKTVGNCTLN